MEITAANSRPRTNRRSDPCRIVGCRAEPPTDPDSEWSTVLIGGTIGAEAGVLTDTWLAAGNTQAEAQQSAIIRAAKWNIPWLREKATTREAE